MADLPEKPVRNGHGGARPGAGRKPKLRPTVIVSTPMPGIGAVNATTRENPHIKATIKDRSALKRSKPARSLDKASALSLPEVCPNAAGIDIGATLIFAAVPEDRAEPNVRSFPTFTEDLYALADWLRSCHIEHVAMEATGVYWIPLFQILEKRGFHVTLVNARNVKNVPGRKSDVKDSRWIQFLHAVGLLQGSFRPTDDVCALRAYMRHRDKLVSVASSHVQRMQKSLTQMNIQLHNVISDITGVTGLAILDSILDGQRDPALLAELCDVRIKAEQETVRKSLVGDYRAEHIFTLAQELRAYRFYQELIKECDSEMEVLLNKTIAATSIPDSLQDSPSNVGVSNPDPAGVVKIRTNASLKTARESRLTVALAEIFNTDLTLVPGLGVDSVYKLFTELGIDLSVFPTAQHFCSWLGLSPDNRVSGGKILSAKTRHVPSRAAAVFRLAANSLQRNKSPLGDYLRRMKARLGKQEGITATAHKIARVFYHLVTTEETYDEVRFQPTDAQIKRRAHKLAREAAKLGYTLTPNSVP